MAGYTRQSSADIVTGENVLAEPINREYNKLQDAFHATTGHDHGGGTGQGPKLALTSAVTGVLPVANGGFAGIHKVNGTTAPTTGDDTGDGYVVGSHWLDTTNDVFYIALDVTLGAAVWQRMQIYDADLAAIAALTPTDNAVIIGNGAAWVAESGATLKTSLGLTIGTDVQAYDATLAALAAYNTNGILTQTAADTFVGRTLAGTAAEITVTNGDGVAGAPTFSLPTALTFSGKTVTNGTFSGPTISGSPTAAGATWTNLGTVTTADINGGTIDGTIIGGASAAAITGTVITANTSILPDANDGAVIGASGNGFSDIFLADGAVLNANAGDTVVTMNDGLVLTGSATDLLVDLSAANAGQIKFPAIQNTSADVNTLDDYEEGIWTPTLTTDNVNFTSVTYDAVTAGTYTKVGRVVYIIGRLRTDAVTVGAASGNVIIGGLPFTSGAAPEASITVSDCASWAGEEPLAGLVGTGTTTIFWHYRTAVDAGTSLLQVADVGTGANANNISFSGFYFV